jgi:regulator of protease activity HflC (stomatin/prohibitin superfamily)
MLIVLIVLMVLIIAILLNGAVIVPQRSAYIVERLGRYNRTLEAGFHVLFPFIDRIAYKRSLKETPFEVSPQQCITKDNITVEVDGILYLQVMNPVRAAYGIDDYIWASSQLAQTTMRSEIGKLDLDAIFEVRESINAAICGAVDKASDPWGVKVTRYEIKSITPPRTIRDAMEKQMRAEREKRAMIAESEGERQACINRAEGEKQEAIARSEGEKTRRINEAEGRAQEILLVAQATADGLASIANAISSTEGGVDAVNLRLAEQYIAEFGKLAKESNTMVLPSNLTDIASVVNVATSVLSKK